MYLRGWLIFAQKFELINAREHLFFNAWYLFNPLYVRTYFKLYIVKIYFDTPFVCPDGVDEGGRDGVFGG